CSSDLIYSIIYYRQTFTVLFLFSFQISKTPPVLSTSNHTSNSLIASKLQARIHLKHIAIKYLLKFMSFLFLDEFDCKFALVLPYYYVHILGWRLERNALTILLPTSNLLLHLINE